MIISLHASNLKKYTWDYVVCADAGMKFCHTAGIQPDLILGDFDSVDDASYTYFKETCPERMEQFPTHKDETDTELALLRAIAAGADAVTMIGATGTRIDHLLGNIQMLKLALDRGVPCQIVDAHNRIRMVDGRLCCKNLISLEVCVTAPFYSGSYRYYIKGICL